MAASRVACASFNLGTNTTITITRDSNAYTHTLKYSFNGATGTIVTKTTETNYVWTPPTSTFYSKIPDTTSGYGTITCETYEGNTLVGTTTAGFYAYTVKNACLPEVRGEVIDTNPDTISVTGDASKLVRYISKPKCIANATAKNGATIKTIQIENPVGLVAMTSPCTFDTVYGKEFLFKAMDSRGYSDTALVNIGTFIEYDPCYFDSEPVVRRTESTSTVATVSLTGYCFRGNFGSASNTLTVKYRYKAGNGSYGAYTTISTAWNEDGTFSANASIHNLSLGETYTIEFVVQDKLTAFPIETVLGQGTGDLRIAKDYVLVKNNLYLGSVDNTEFRAIKARRVLNGKRYEANFGAGDEGSCAIELYEDGTQVAKYDLRKDGYMYDALSQMSVAEIMSYLPDEAKDGSQGYFLLNGSTDPVLVQWGRVVMTPEGPNTVTKQEIKLLYPFSSLPFVCLDKSVSTPSPIFTSVNGVTKDGFSIYLQRSNTESTPILWVAIGNGKLLKGVSK